MLFSCLNLGVITVIRLEVEDYCQNCIEFDPEKEVIAKQYMESKDEEYLTFVTCKNADRCRRLMKHLKKKME